MYGYPVTNRVIGTTKGYTVTLGAGGYSVTLYDTASTIAPNSGHLVTPSRKITLYLSWPTGAPVLPLGTTSSTIDGSYGLITTTAPTTKNPLTAQIIVAREGYYQL